MNYQELDEEEKARKRAEFIARKNKKNASRLFMVSMSVFEIVETLAIIIILFLISAFLTFKVFKAEGNAAQIAFEITSIIIFIGGMVLGFFVYKAFARWIIKKFKLEEKIDKDILEHYKTKAERKNPIDELRR